MAILTIGDSWGFAGPKEFSGFRNAAYYERSATTFMAVSSDPDFPENQTLTGTGLTYNDSGELIGGNVTKYTFSEGIDFRLVFSLANLSVAATALYAVAKTPGTADDYSFFESLLSGSDIIRGSGETIEGEGPGDVLNGYSGNDFIHGNWGDDELIGGKGADSLFGEENWDLLQGGDGKDFLDGGSGNDTASYSDKIVDLIATLNYKADSSVIVDGAIEDTLRSIENLIGGSGNDSFTGDAMRNRLEGGGGNDILDGGTGFDTLLGGTGDDIYYVENPRDILIEFAGQGTADWVVATINFALPSGAEIEILSTELLAGTGTISLMGNSVGQTIYGNDGANVLSGKAGNDTLISGGGADVFFFDTALNASTNVDKITDYNVAADTIWLEGGIFAGIIGTGALTSSQFAKNSTGTAQDGSDRIIYETDTGKLFYDSNGSAAGGSVQFATLTAGLALTGWDFHIV